MNYSIISTEISFYLETSILLPIVRIIYMTIWIIQELDIGIIRGLCCNSMDANLDHKGENLNPLRLARSVKH